MANFIGDFFLSLVMSKKARENLDTYRETNRAIKAIKAKSGGGPAGGPTGGGASSREQAIANMKASGQGLVTEDRAELIRHAMEVRKAKQKLMDNLNDEERQKLMALALKLLMKEEVPPKE